MPAANQPPFFATHHEALQSHTVDWLKKLASTLEEKKLPLRKAELIARIEQRFEGDGLRQVWQQLDELQQAAVAEGVHGTAPVFQADKFVAKYGASPNWGEQSKTWYGWINPSLLGLFFFNGVIPEDLRQRLASWVPAPEPIALSPIDELPQTELVNLPNWQHSSPDSALATVALNCRETERAAIRDLQAMLQLIDAGKLGVSDKTRLPGKAALTAISSVLLDGDYYNETESSDTDFDHSAGPIRAFAWPLLVQAGGLAALSGKHLALSKAGRKAMGDPPEKVLRALWRKWLNVTWFDELSRIDCIKGQTSSKAKRGLTAVRGRREVIEAALRDCPLQRWVAVDDLFRYMIASGIDFEITRNPWTLYISDANYGNLGYQGFHDWHILQARYALCLLFEYAATLGIIDVAYIPPHYARDDFENLWGIDNLEFLSRYDGLFYLRLTPLGAYCLGLTDNYQPSHPPSQVQLQVLANLDVVSVGEPLSPADELLLASFARRKSEALWHLDRQQLLIALEEGRDIRNLREFLQASSRDPLPETVMQFLSDAEQRACQLQDRGMVRLIECADAVLATQLAHDARTQRYCLLAGERHLAVFADKESRFRSALHKLGYILPK